MVSHTLYADIEAYLKTEYIWSVYNYKVREYLWLLPIGLPMAQLSALLRS